MNVAKNKRIKVVLTIFVGAILLIVLGCAVGIAQTIDKTVNVRVYENNDGSYKNSSVTLLGNLKKTFIPSRCSFVGTFAIECYERSCRDGVEAKIDWIDEDLQRITFFYAGDFSHFDVELIEIDEQMSDMMIVLNDGTIIATENHYIPGSIWMRYQPLS